MAAINFFIILSGAIFLLYILGVHNYLTIFEENKCQMTYMYEYPQYVRIALPEKETIEFPKYALYVYGEGQYTETLRYMRFHGIPVLFVPGNSGSYKQVRSFASVALRKARDSRTSYHFNFFAADFNEEYSALYGGVLSQQTKFIVQSIKAILRLYQDARTPPTSVLLIGHSMGGMVAKSVFLEPDFTPNMVHTIITLATPHTSPVIALDPFVSSFYARINEMWHEESSRPNNVLLVSVGGGHRDLLVRSGLTLEGNVTTLSTAVPGVWVSADHLCVLWCKQLVLSISRAIFDSVNAKTKQISPDPTLRYQAFSYHLLHRNYSKRISTTFYPQEAHFDKDGDWREYLRRQFTVSEAKINKPVYIMVRLVSDPKHERLALEAINLDARDWVFACIADLVHNQVRMCEKGINLSNNTRFLPSIHRHRKGLLLDLHALKEQGFTHVVARLPSSSDTVKLNVDIYSSFDRHLILTALPQMHSHSSIKVLHGTDQGALFYRVALPTLERVWQTAVLSMDTVCTQPKHHAVARLSTDWSREDSHAFVTEAVAEILPIKLQVVKPSSAKKSDTAYIVLQLDPACSYTIRIESSLPSMFGQLVRFEGSQLPAYVAAVLLLSLRTQLQDAARKGSCTSFHSAISSGARPYVLLPLVQFVVLILKKHPISAILPAPDLAMSQTHGMDTTLMSLGLYCVASFIAYLLGLVCWIAIVVWGTTANRLLMKFVSRSLFGGFQWSEWVLSGFARVPSIVAFLLVTLAYSTCGALSLAVGLCFYFILVVKMYEEYLEELIKFPLRLLRGRPMGGPEAWSRAQSLLSELHFHCCGLLLWAVTAALHVPCALEWAHAFQYSARLTPDPSLGPALAFCVCAPVLWQRKMPRPYLKHHKELDKILYILALTCLVYAPLSLYRLSPLLATAVLLVSAQQLLVKSLQPENVQPILVEQPITQNSIEPSEQPMVLPSTPLAKMKAT